MALADRVTQAVVEQITLANPSAVVTQAVIEFIVSLGIICDSPPQGSVGVAYSHTFPAGSGDPPYTFSITAGSLPPGLSLAAATGIVSGVPTAAGVFPFTITVTDTLLATASVACTITITGGSPLRIALYGYKRFKNRPVCAPDLVELPDIPSPPRVL